MNKAELKKILKPLIKECIKEVIFEDGTLSTIISEVMKGASTQKVVVENKKPQFDPHMEERKRKQILNQKRKVLDAIGRDAYNGVDLFEGTTPMKSATSNSSTQGSKALEGVDPADPGVDLGALGFPVGIWKRLAGS